MGTVPPPFSYTILSLVLPSSDHRRLVVKPFSKPLSQPLDILPFACHHEVVAVHHRRQVPLRAVVPADVALATVPETFAPATEFAT